MIDLKPTKQEEQQLMKVANAFVKTLQKKLPKQEVLLGGSVAKGTWVKGKADVDIFVRFLDDKNISDKVEKVLPEAERVPGSRDYFRLKNEGYQFEVVPILKIKKADEARNITDVSPLHTKWVRKHITEKLREEILLSKQFFQANRLYGAESHIKGFSGYVLEILTIHYGSFKKLLRAATKWKEKAVVDTEKHHKDVFFEVNHSKLSSPLIVIDPVQPGRNAAAALSEETFQQCQTIAAAYLEHPSDDFFVKKTVSKEQLQKRKNMFVLPVLPKEGKPDVVGCKLLKAFTFIKRKLEPFGIKDAGWEWEEEAFFYFQLKSVQLPKTHVVTGPPEDIKEHVAIFKKKYPQAKKKQGIWVAVVETKERDAEKILKKAITSSYVRERVKKI